MYEVGYALGCHWSTRDATAYQLFQIQVLGDGREWVENSANPIEQIKTVVDPEGEEMFGSGESPSKSFLAGFVNGCRSA